jgi:8-oxo-dGTP pyrophosphatase MutT (NUDIX family)
MMVRDSPQGYEILMLRRNLNSDFVGGAYVFPGGGVDAADATASAEQVVKGRNDAQASQRLGIESGGLAYYVACLRELFEEAGVLIARTSSGELLRFDDPDVAARFRKHRRSVNDGSVRFLDIISSEGLSLDLEALEYVAHWVTPVGPPRRYDTRFFVAMCPPAQLAAHDDHETVADVWLRPREALLQHERGEFEMIFPTIKNLEAIADLETANEVLLYARNKQNIPKIEPKFIERDGEVVITIPEDS